ncbi:MAG: PepSY-associated TM helix domain-containing protein [Tenacibaculum sp.]
MSNRNYNVFFNLHTVSGITISIALYVIFFAGAFALFKNEIKAWEEGTALSHTQIKDVDFDKILNKLDEQYELIGRDLYLILAEDTDKIFVRLGASKSTLATKKGKIAQYFYIDIHTGEKKTYKEQYSLGEFLYRLHFFNQLPYGIYLSGFVSLFFLFAIITGVIIHWKKIISNFFSFNPKVILKRVWADAHTALGVIGLPFQFIFAVTGTYFAISIFVFMPINFLYQGNTKAFREDIRPELKNYPWLANSDKSIASVNTFAQKTTQQWDDFHLNRLYIKNYRGTNMKYIFIGQLNTDKRFIGFGRTVYDSSTKSFQIEKDPNKLNYMEDVQRLVSRLHFANFGGLFLKASYFILALISCFVILTGVLIWTEARNRKNMSLKKRRFTAKVGHIYIATCLSLLPVTALAFLFVKLSNGYFSNKQSAIYYFFFSIWLLFILFFRFKRDNYYTNKICLLLGAIFGFSIPICNGIVSANWFWVSFKNNQNAILVIDILWMLLASLSLISYIKIKSNIKTRSSFSKHPIEYPSKT